MEATRGNGYAPVRGSPAMMMIMMMMMMMMMTQCHHGLERRYLWQSTSTSRHSSQPTTMFCLWMFDAPGCPLLATERFLLQLLVCRTVFHRKSLLLPVRCCLKSHLFSLSYPVSWLLFCTVPARWLVILDAITIITLHCITVLHDSWSRGQWNWYKHGWVSEAADREGTDGAQLRVGRGVCNLSGWSEVTCHYSLRSSVLSSVHCSSHQCWQGSVAT